MKEGIIVFAFGQPSTISSNLQLAHSAMHMTNTEIKNIFTQRDIVTISYSIRIKIEYVEEHEKPPSTLFIAEKSLEWAKKLGLKKVYVVAASPHEWRCLRDVKKVYSGTKIRVVLHKMPQKRSFWYNRDSTQARTRSWLLWWPREILLRLLPFFIYKRVAR